MTTFLNLKTTEFTEKFATAQKYKKSAIIHARQVNYAEHLDTILESGLLETSRVVPVGHWIITNPGGEEYAVSDEKFKTRYDHIGDGRFTSHGVIRAFQNPTGTDIEILAPWGEPQYGDAQCFLASTCDDEFAATQDLYIIGYQEFLDTYQAI